MTWNKKGIVISRVTKERAEWVGNVMLETFKGKHIRISFEILKPYKN